MKERPILMSAPMVRATLRDVDPKTQTRRVAPIRDLNILRHPGDMVTWTVSFLKAVKGVLASHSGGKFSDLQARSIIASQFNPYGQPGDRLWVREAWRTYASLDGIPPRDIRPGAGVQYEAGGTNVPGDRGEYLLGMGRLRPGMFMPRWASRITLEITAVRVERLQDISGRDCLAEGIAEVEFRPDDGFPMCLGYMVGPNDGKTSLKVTPQESYRELWEQINGPGSWEKNPWVWVVEFKRIVP